MKSKEVTYKEIPTDMKATITFLNGERITYNKISHVGFSQNEKKEKLVTIYITNFKKKVFYSHEIRNLYVAWLKPQEEERDLFFH